MAKAKKAKKRARTTKKAVKKKAVKRAAKAARVSKAVAARAAAAPASGPVTLEEARALALAKRPVLAERAAAAAATSPQSPEAVGTERERLEKQRRDERKRRINEYKAVMDIMKARGARAPSGPRRARAATDEAGGGGPEAAPTAGFAPLQILAEGDSWFDYPPFYLVGGALITRLERSLGVPILNLAKAGDEVRYMLGVEERIVLTQQLTNGSPAGGPWDVVLFSGGGNDVVDNPMALWVKNFNPAVPPATLINQPRFDAALALVRAGYEDLIALRDDLSPNTHLVFHGYDCPLPDGRGVCGFGPWLKPTFDLRGFPAALASRTPVVNAMLAQFAAMLTTLARPNVSFINSQGTLPPQASSWHNELHPTRAGFDRHAALFRQKLKQLFPARVA